MARKAWRYRKMLEQAKKERAQLLRKLDQNSEEIRHLEGILTTLEKLVPSGATQTAMGFEGRFSDKSAPAAAEIVLRENQGFMHIGDIVGSILKGGYKKQPDFKKLKVSLFSNLARNDKFVKHPEKKATFGLAEWKSEENK